MIKNWTIIKCEKCWREITAKMGRTLCIRCTNLKYKNSQAELRKNRKDKSVNTVVENQ